MLDEIRKRVVSILSDWIQVIDFKSRWTIEDFPYETGVDDEVTYPHCWKCVTINNCWFKNENGKKPEEFIGVDILQNFVGLYHFNCHCQKVGIKTPMKIDIKLILIEGKIDWLFKDKIHMLKAKGYSEEDKTEILKLLYDKTKESYTKGDYLLRIHDKYGFKITTFFTFPGAGIKKENRYNLQGSWMIFPNGKLKLNTLIGGMI